MRATNKRLTILTETEQSALYGLPDFNDEQREYLFQLTEEEYHLVISRSSLSAKVYCLLQMTYFKVKESFFDFTWDDVSEEDILFILQHYFPHIHWEPEPITRHEYYEQRKAIKMHFGYQDWSTLQHEANFIAHLQASVRRDVTLPFILPEALAWLKERRIIRPGYTTLQLLISQVLQAERQRLGEIIKPYLSEDTKIQLSKLLSTDTTLSELAALKQDAKDFKYRMMQSEIQKLSVLRPLYEQARNVLPQLEVSQQNLRYYASLANYHTAYELRRLQPEQAHLYLLCYAWQRYQQLTDNLAEAFCYQGKQFDDTLKLRIKELRQQSNQQQEKQSKSVGFLLALFTDESFADHTPYGQVRKAAFAILDKDKIQALSDQFIKQSHSALQLRWQLFDKEGYRFRKYLRPLFLELDFSSQQETNRWLQAFQLIRQRFQKKQPLPVRNRQLMALIPKRLEPYLLTQDKKGEVQLHAERYEYWAYRQCRKRLLSGELHLDDSTRHRSLERELISSQKQAALLSELTLPRLQMPIHQTLKQLSHELTSLWKTFNRKLKKGDFKHLQFDKATGKLSFKKLNINDHEESQVQFYNKLPSADITTILQFVNEQCQFLKVFKPLKQLHSKKLPLEGKLFAAIMAEAMNHGLPKMADISDIPYHTLKDTKKQYLRLATLKAASYVISNRIKTLGIFPYYELGFDKRYGSVDGQKYEVERPTLKARYSKKYFGKGRGVVAYTLLCNHVPLQTDTISAHEHESYYTFDIVYHNTSDIIPEAISGDMHSINKANFAILDWFGYHFSPRFTNLDKELNQIYGTQDENHFANFLIQPAGKINLTLIEEKWPQLQRIMLTLAQKEISQSTLVKKLCTYSYANRTRKALFEYDKLIRSMYTLKYIMDPKLQQQVQRSQNRIESYHQLRAAIAEVNGKKQLAGKTDIEIGISNQCGRLLANAMIYYNSIILTKLMEKYQSENNTKVLNFLTKLSPVAYQHIHLLGHYIFNLEQSGIDLDAIIAELTLSEVLSL